MLEWHLDKRPIHQHEGARRTISFNATRTEMQWLVQRQGLTNIIRKAGYYINSSLAFNALLKHENLVATEVENGSSKKVSSLEFFFFMEIQTICQSSKNMRPHIMALNNTLYRHKSSHTIKILAQLINENQIEQRSSYMQHIVSYCCLSILCLSAYVIKRRISPIRNSNMVCVRVIYARDACNNILILRVTSKSVEKLT